MEITFKKTHSSNRGTSTYRSVTADGKDGALVLYLPKSAGEHPDEIGVNGMVEPEPGTSAKGPKLSKEEIKAKAAAERARFKALTPEEQAAEKRAKAQKALDAAKARAAKMGLDLASIETAANVAAQSGQ